MAETYRDVTHLRRTSWDVSFNGAPLGFVDDVDPDIQIVTEDIGAGSVGDIPLGAWIVGLDGTIKVKFRESTADLWNALLCWNVGIPYLLSPSTAADLYDYAEALVLHPHDLAAEETDEDITLLKAAPNGPPGADRDGVSDDVLVGEFLFYPDRDVLAATEEIRYGYVGPAPVDE
jgi:hypothetical protein